MSFTTPIFFLFFALVILLYYLLPQKGQWVVLLLASYVFYIWQMPKFGLLLLFSTAVSYLIARLIEQWRKKLWLTVGCVFQFGLLFAFKYLDFVVSLFPNIPSDFTFGLLQPIRISFFTFAVTGYLFDVYRGKCGAEHNVLRYAVFVSFFPSLLAGPIGRARDFLPQLDERHRFSLSGLKFGILRFLFGMMEKLVLADTIAIAVNAAYDGAALTPLTWIFVISLYSLQIYFDFAGYTHMALGVASALGFRLTENFEAPYFSASVRSFWKKWHISLTAWLREYLYFPLGGSKKGTFRTCLNIMIVFAVSGLWHGAAVTYLIWGLLNGLLQVIERLLDPLRKRLAEYGGILRIMRLFVGGCITFLLITCAWVFFRSDSVQQAIRVFGNILDGFRSGFGTLCLADLGFTPLHLIVIIIGTAVCAVIDYLHTHGRKLARLSERIVPYYLIVYLLIMAVLIFGVYGAGFDPQTFVYFKY